jgi:hypothetical protein
MLDTLTPVRAPETLTREWTARDRDGTPLAHQRLELAPALASSPELSSPAPCLCALRAATGDLELDWSSSTWPTLIRPATQPGSALGVDAIEPGLLIVERASGEAGEVLVHLEATVPARRASAAVLESLSVARLPAR